jgi:transposase-like protein
MRRLTKTKRARYSAQERQRLVAEWRQSGQTQEAFAGARRIRLGTLRRWVSRGEPPEGGLGRSAFLELTPPGQALDVLMSSVVEIAVGPEITMRLKGAWDPDVVARLVGRLRRPC